MKPDYSNIRRALTRAGLAVLLVATLGQAQQQSVPNTVQLEAEEEPVRLYSVEMIVFQYVGDAAGTTEMFNPDVEVVDDLLPREPGFLEGLPPGQLEDAAPQAGDIPVAIDLPVTVAEDEEFEEEAEFVLLPEESLEEIPTYESAGFILVDPAEYQLTNAWNRLVQLDAYQPLMHTAWIQPTVEKEDTAPVPLRRLGDPPLRLEGSISLYLSRFLHMVVDLSLEQKSAVRLTATEQRIRSYPDNQSRAALSFDPRFISPSVFYRIEEDRIVRNNELRYFDHPKFGVLAKITRIEEEEPEELDTTDDLLPGNPIQ
ncbi:MAG: CsiV family protein [Woeseiaceae bacterium]